MIFGQNQVKNLMIFRTFTARVRLRKHISTFIRPLGGEFCPGGQLKYIQKFK